MRETIRVKALALGACFFMFAVYLLVPLGLLVVGGFLTGNSGDISGYISHYGDFYMPFGSLLAFILIARREKQKRGIGFLKLSSLRLEAPYKPLYLVFLGASLNIGVSSVLALLPASLTAGYAEAASRKGDLLMAVISLTITAPLFEEVLFRGFLQTRLLKAFPMPACVALVAAAFGLMHVQPVWVVYAAAMSVVLSLTAIWTKNVLNSIIVHMSFNLISLPQVFIDGNPLPVPITVITALGAFALTVVSIRALYQGRSDIVLGKDENS